MPKKAPKKTIKKKPKSRMYFTMDTEKAIIAYNASDDHREKNVIYNDSLQYPLEKLAENIIHTFKFYHFDQPIESVKHEVVSFLITRLDKFREGQGKAFSYFSVVAKNWLICHNNANYKQMKTHNDVLELKHKDVGIVAYRDKGIAEEDQSLFFKKVIEYWEDNITKVFKKDRDIKIAWSILELMDKVQSIEIFNKKALYILLREISGSKTQQITRVLNVMRTHFKALDTQWSKEGNINTTPRSIRMF